MVKRIITTLLTVVAIYFTSCTKHDPPPVTGTINGIPATTLYGSSGNATDYILIVISTNTNNNLISYEGHTYSYTNGSGNDVYIEISPTNVVRGTLTTSGTQTVLTVVNPSPAVFLSSQYASR